MEQILAPILAAFVTALLQAPVIATNPKRFVRTAIAVLAALLIGVVVYLLFQWTAGPSAPELRITTPRQGDSVPRLVTIEGSSSLPAGAPVWVLVEYQDRYYPQQSAIADSSGHWNELTYIGNEKTRSGTPYHVVAIAGTGTGGKGLDAVFRAYREVCATVRQYPGLTALPSLSGMTITRVAVKRA
jgi:hypothetical protein